MKEDILEQTVDDWFLSQESTEIGRLLQIFRASEIEFK
jgi:hypothetical protein